MPKVIISCIISEIFNSERGCSRLLTHSMWFLSALSNLPSFSPPLHISFPLSAQLRSFEYHELSWQWIGRLSSQTRPKSQRSNTSDWSILTLVIHNVQSYVAFLEFWCIYSVILVANTHLKSESIAKKKCFVHSQLVIKSWKCHWDLALSLGKRVQPSSLPRSRLESLDWHFWTDTISSLSPPFCPIFHDLSSPDGLLLSLLLLLSGLMRIRP